MKGKVRYWRETAGTEFYELWPEPAYNKIELVVLKCEEPCCLTVIKDEDLEDHFYGDDDDE